MYCVKCGVELADSERVCPLCETPVYFPGLDTNPETPYPKAIVPKESSKTKAVCFLITCFFVLAAVICFVCDFNLNEMINWSDTVFGSLLVAYVIFVLPSWFKNPLPAVFVPCDFVAIALLLFYIDFRFDGGWYFSFAFPVTIGAAIICCSVSILAYYLRRGRLYIAAGAIIATGAYSIFIELCLHSAFHIQHMHMWSIYPATAFLVIGLMLIVIAIVRPWKEHLYKIFAF